MTKIIIDSASKIDALLKDFHGQLAQFESHFTRIRFSPKLVAPFPEDPPAPPIELNEFFLLHRDAINRVLTSLDTVSSYGDEVIRSKRKSGHLAVQSHLEHLDQLVENAWNEVKREQIGTNSPSDLIVYNCGMLPRFNLNTSSFKDISQMNILKLPKN